MLRVGRLDFEAEGLLWLEKKESADLACFIGDFRCGVLGSWSEWATKWLELWAFISGASEETLSWLKCTSPLGMNWFLVGESCSAECERSGEDGKGNFSFVGDAGDAVMDDSFDSTSESAWSSRPGVLWRLLEVFCFWARNDFSDEDGVALLVAAVVCFAKAKFNCFLVAGSSFSTNLK